MIPTPMAANPNRRQRIDRLESAPRASIDDTSRPFRLGNGFKGLERHRDSTHGRNRPKVYESNHQCALRGWRWVKVTYFGFESFNAEANRPACAGHRRLRLAVKRSDIAISLLKRSDPCVRSAHVQIERYDPSEFEQSMRPLVIRLKAIGRVGPPSACPRSAGFPTVTGTH
jgi:hypothetical protein